MINDLKFLNIEWRKRCSLTNFEDRFGLRAYLLRLQYMHLYIGLIPNSSGQLAELIVHIIPLG